MDLLTLAVIAAFSGGKGTKSLFTRNNINKRYAEMQAVGQTRETNCSLESQLLGMIIENEMRQESSVYPESKIEFLKQDAAAKLNYRSGMVRSAIIDLGYKPMGVPTFNIYSYNPYWDYNNNYAAEEYKWYLARLPNYLQEFYDCSIYTNVDDAIVFGNDTVFEYLKSAQNQSFIEWRALTYGALKKLSIDNVKLIANANDMNRYFSDFRKLQYYLCIRTQLNKESLTKQKLEQVLNSTKNH
ncbi:MAG: hypothetical protein Q8T08_15595 [Ignavibacteria bacterium]|nr:hypothetical protein [Ignavibacteria bacterium]